MLKYIETLVLHSEAYGLRMVGRTLLSAGPSDAIKSIRAREYSEAWNFLVRYEQTKRLDPSKMQSI